MTISPPGAGESLDRQSPAPRTILQVSLWVGLVAGFLDLAFTVLHKHLIDREDFYRLGEGFPWLVPAGVAGIVLLPGAVLASLAWLGAVRVSLRTTVALASFLGALDLCALLPLHHWASFLLSAGLAMQAARLVGRHDRGFLEIVRRTCPVILSAVVVLAAATSGLRSWAEYRKRSQLPPPSRSARNILLVVWDTVRARNLGVYGHARKTTPNLERLAARGVRFRHAYSTAPWTLPSHASLFTGRWPHELSAGWKTALDSEYPTIAEALTDVGYDTAGFVANLDYCGSETGLARGFTHYEDYPLTPWEVFSRYTGLGRRIDQISIAMIADLLTGGRLGGGRPIVPLSREHAKGAADIDRSFLDWLSWQRNRGRPFFAFLNYNDAHTPYKIPDDGAAGFGVQPASWHDRLVLHQWNMLDKTKLPYDVIQMANDLYDDAIAYLDRRLGLLLNELERRGVAEDTIVIVTSDHGEHLGDHLLFFHGCSLYRQAVEVPLVIADPRGESPGRVVDVPVSLRDLPATIAGLLGIDRATAFPGRSLARFWAPAAESLPASESILMETDKPVLLTNQGREPAARGPMKALISGGMHYIRNGDGREELYSLEHDLDQRTNLAGIEQARGSLERFRAALRAMLQTPPSAGGRTAALIGEDHRDPGG
ncbi:MAG: sulfatase [Isosphaeraceae bacterium]